MPPDLTSLLASLGSPASFAPLGPAPAAPSLPAPTPNVPLAPAGIPQQGGNRGAFILQQVMPFVLAGLAAKNGGKVAAGAMLNGYSKGLAEQKQREAEAAQQAAQAEITEEARQLRLAEFQARRQNEIIQFGDNILKSASDAMNAAEAAARVKIGNERGREIYGPMWRDVQVAPGKTKAEIAKAEKDQAAAASLLKDAEASLRKDGNWDRALAENWPIENAAFGKTTLRELQALVGTKITDAQGNAPKAAPPKVETPNTDYAGYLARFARRRNKSVEDLTEAEELLARKSFYQADDRPQAQGSEPLISVLGPDGKPTLVPRSQAVGMEPTTSRRAVLGTERQALAYFNRAKEALETAEPLEPEIAKMNLLGQAGLEYLPNWLQSQTGQSYRQAQRSFTEARLRKESGAAIPKEEYASDARTYFAVPGDTAETLAQKRAARQEVLDGLGFSAGTAYQEFYGAPFQRKAPSATGAGSGPKEGDEKPIPGVENGVAKFTNGRWIRIR